MNVAVSFCSFISKFTLLKGWKLVLATLSPSVKIQNLLIGIIIRPVARWGRGVRSHPPPPPTGPKSPHFGTQSPTFRVQSVKVKDGYIEDTFSLWDHNKQEVNLS